MRFVRFYPLALVLLLLVGGGACRIAGVCIGGEENCSDNVSDTTADSTDCTNATLVGQWNTVGDSPSATFDSTCNFSGENSNGCNFTGTYTPNSQLSTGTFYMRNVQVSTCSNTAIVNGDYTCTYTVTYSDNNNPVFEQRTGLALTCVLGVVEMLNTGNMPLH